MWKHYVIAVLPKAFCFWFLTEKQQLKHPCLTDVQIVPFVDPWTNAQIFIPHAHCSFDTYQQSFPDYNVV